jgi:hypothetical protein
MKNKRTLTSLCYIAIAIFSLFIGFLTMNNIIDKLLLPMTQHQKDLHSFTGEIAYAVYVKNIGRKVAIFETKKDATRWISFIGDGEVIPTRIPPISHAGPDDYVPTSSSSK